MHVIITEIDDDGTVTVSTALNVPQFPFLPLPADETGVVFEAGTGTIKKRERFISLDDVLQRVQDDLTELMAPEAHPPDGEEYVFQDLPDRDTVIANRQPKLKTRPQAVGE